MSDSLTRMVLAVRQAGLVARRLQGRVENDGKDAGVVIPDEDARGRRSREAKTVVDEAAQDILLLAAAEVLDTRCTTVDAEESTETTHLFLPFGGSATLVVDPVDGTAEYLEGRASYSICIGLIEASSLSWAIVLFPARDELFVLDEDGQPWTATGILQGGLDGLRPLAGQPVGDRTTVFVNARVSREIQEALRAAGYTVHKDIYQRMGAPDCILACLSSAAAYVSHTRQARDILLGGILGAVPGGYALDWSGQTLSWPPGGRVSRAIFGWGHYDPRLAQCLSTDVS